MRMRSFNNSSKTNPGFTLVEVLVVTGIIAVLAGIGLGVSSPMREKARQSSCASNLRQLQNAVMLYTTDVDAGEEVLGLGPLSCAVARSGAKVIYSYVKDKGILYCPDLPAPIRTRMATSYIWKPVPRDFFTNPTGADLNMLNEQAAEINRVGTQFPLWTCTIHDELFYAPSERDINPIFAKMFVVEVSVSGSIYTGRRPYLRGGSLIQSILMAPEKPSK